MEPNPSTQYNVKRRGRKRAALADDDEARLDAARQELDAALKKVATLLAIREGIEGYPLKLAFDAFGFTPRQGRDIIAAGGFILTRVDGKDMALDGFPFFAIVQATKSKDGLMPDDLLKRALESADDYGGKPAPARVIRAWARGKRKPKRPTWTGKVVNSGGDVVQLDESKEMPKEGSAVTIREM